MSEPVAYRYRWKLDGEWTRWRVSDHSQKSQYLKDLEEQPLYEINPEDYAFLEQFHKDVWGWLCKSGLVDPNEDEWPGFKHVIEEHEAEIEAQVVRRYEKAAKERASMEPKTLQKKITEAEERCNRYLADANEAAEQGRHAKADKLYEMSHRWLDRANKLRGWGE